MSAWDVLYPRRSGTWSGYAGGRPARYDPGTQRLRTVDAASDSRLPQLAGWLDVGVLAGYRAGARAAVEVDLGERHWFAKVTTASRLRRLVAAEDLVRQAVAAGGPPSTEEAVGVADRPGAGASHTSAAQGRLVLATRSALFDGAAVYPAASGVALHDLLMAPRPEVGNQLRLVGAAVATLHGLAVPAGASAGAPYGIEEWCAWVSDHDPDCPPSILAGAASVARRYEPIPEAAVLIHGDLHDKNVFVSDRGSTLIDLTSVRAGRPAEDVGMLGAHLILRALQAGRTESAGATDVGALLEGYRAAGGPARADAIEVEIIRTLARLTCLYRFRRRWHALTPVLLDVALAAA